MTNTYQPSPPGPSPEHERPNDDDIRAHAPAHDAPGADTQPQDAEAHHAPSGEAHESQTPTIDSEQERLVWTPPLPKYPPRLTRQEEPVQYQAPRPQPAPQYAPQQYVPPQPEPQQPYVPPQPTPPPAPSYPQQQMYAPAIAGGYSAPVAQYGAPPQTVITMPAPRPTKARLARRMARRMVMGADGARKAMFGVRPTLAIFFVIFLLLSGWFAYDKWLAGSGSSTGPNGASKGGTVTLPPETPAVQTYLTAVQKGDADAVWNTLGAQEKAHRISRGDDKTVLTAVLQAEQQNGFKYTGYHYVAGYGKAGSADPSKGGIYFYVADVGQGTQTTSVPMVFQMDDKGQISQVSDQLYDFVLQQLKGSGN